MASTSGAVPVPRVPSLANGTFKTIIRDHVLKPHQKDQFPDEQWRLLPEIPSSAEIMGTHDYLLKPGEEAKTVHIQLPEDSTEIRPGLPTNIIDGPWKDSASYIGAHYQLLREDALYPLRKAVANVMANPTMKDDETLAIYTHVHIIGITFSPQGPALKVEFSYENAGKRIRWEQSERLQQGTIVALTPRSDMFREVCKVAVVAARPIKEGVELNPPRLDLFWADWSEAEIDPTVNWVMVEARTGYWESFRHMGVALQKLRSESFPHSKYLVNLPKTIGSPRHVTYNPYTNMNSLLSDGSDNSEEFENVNILKTWPEMPSNLDASQLEATKRILTKQIAIIQGPPGTGKTFVSLTSLKIMLDSWAPGDPPIIIAAQTNHALDQLLLLIEPHAPDFIRLGGRTSDGTGVIKKRTVFEVRKALGGAAGPSGDYRNVSNAMQSIQMSMLSCLNLIINNERISGDTLLDLKIITQEQFDSLKDPQDWVTARQDPELDTDICNWVGNEYMCRLESKCPPINALFEEEELEDQYEKLNEGEAETGANPNDDENIDRLKGEFYTLRQSWTGQRTRGWSERKVKNLLKSTSNLWDIDNEVRGDIYCYFQCQVNREIDRNFRSQCKEYMRCVDNRKICKWEADYRMIMKQNIKVIGATTTGLSKYRGLIASLKPRTLLIEEAAETVEGTVLAAMLESLDHLILVGDHQQLQAKCNLTNLSNNPYNLAISLFERLVKNGLEYTMLNKQRRMIPAIRKTFSHVYPHLNDHSSVLDRFVNRPRVPGMARDIFWFHHVYPESRMDTSRCNIDEAEHIVRFFDYLVLNHIDASKITVLTFYNGQKKVLLRMLKSHPNLKEITYFNVFTVDSYQGEENDIILLSLVRSNNTQSCGFLANRNRVVVSLSRARRGLYVFGNVLNLIVRKGEGANVWGPVVEAFRHENMSLADKLPLTCENHRETAFIQDPSDWDAYGIVGGCRMECRGVLPCGHNCPLKCHPFDHERLVCKELCLRSLPCGHVCDQDCGENCFCLECAYQPEEPQPEASGSVASAWTAPPDFLRSVKQTLVRTPMPLPSGVNNSSHHSSNHQVPTVGGRSTNYSTPAQWVASARAPETLAQSQPPVVNANLPSEISVPAITDIFRQVTVTEKGRSAPSRRTERDIPAQTQHFGANGGENVQLRLNYPDTPPYPAITGLEGLSLVTNQGGFLSRPNTPSSLLDGFNGHGFGAIGSSFNAMTPLIELPFTPAVTTASPLQVKNKGEDNMVVANVEDDCDLLSFD